MLGGSFLAPCLCTLKRREFVEVLAVRLRPWYAAQPTFPVPGAPSRPGAISPEEVTL